MGFAWVLQGFCEELNPFLFEREREGYKRFADCTVPCGSRVISIFIKIPRPAGLVLGETSSLLCILVAGQC